MLSGPDFGADDRGGKGHVDEGKGGEGSDGEGGMAEWTIWALRKEREKEGFRTPEKPD